MGTRLAGKVALISGSTRGIGRSMAELFGAEGAKVAVTGRTVEKGEKVVARIREAGGEAEFFRLDINDEGSVRDVVDSTVKRLKLKVRTRQVRKSLSNLPRGPRVEVTHS